MRTDNWRVLAVGLTAAALASVQLAQAGPENERLLGTQSSTVEVGSLRLAYETYGPEDGEVVLLIAGIDSQLTMWPPELVDELARRGYRVIVYDHRDVGLSTKLDDAGSPDWEAIFLARAAGREAPAPYTLHDLAQDAVGLLEALDVERAHVVGASMGGQIALIVAADYPERVRSLTVLMSDTLNPALPPPRPNVTAAMMLPDRSQDPGGYAADIVRLAQTIGSPAFPTDEARLREAALRDFRRSYYPAGGERHAAALYATADLRPKLPAIRVPTIVVHGADDLLVSVEGGRDIVRHVEGAELRVIDGMGHDLPVALVSQFADAIVAAATGAVHPAAVDDGPAAQAARPTAIQSERVVAGGPDAFMEVRHLVLRGTNQEIGESLATIAYERYQSVPVGTDPLRTRAQRRYIQRHYPILFERMRGSAAVFGQEVENDAWDFSRLWYLPTVTAACSVVYFPPATTTDGRAVISRNFDFHTGTADRSVPGPGELGMFARPYVIEMYPDDGYPSLFVCSNDLMSSAFDGINSEGLTVTLLATDDLAEGPLNEPAGESGVGLMELQVPRLLLDTCADVDEAKQALLMTKQYYAYLRCHYLIADRHGNAFIWELSPGGNRYFIIENPGGPLVATNFSQHRHGDGQRPPAADAVRDVCPRYAHLAERASGPELRASQDDIRQIHAAADATMAAGPQAATRTLWHVLYFPEQRSMRATFYLGDKPDPDQPDRAAIVRSDPLELSLDAMP